MPSARAVQWAILRVVILVISALTILSVVVYLLSNGALFRQHAYLRLYVPDATGLVTGHPVRLNGIDVGKIDAVRLSGSSNPQRIVEVRLAVDEGYLRQIPRDSIAAANVDNLLGDKYIDITKGTSPQTLSTGSELRFQPAQDMLKQIDLEQFETQLRAIDQLLADIEAGNNDFGKFVTTDQLYRDTVTKAAQLERDVHAAVSTTGALGQLLYRDTAYREVGETLRSLDRRLEEIQNGPFVKDPAGYEQMRGFVGQVRRTVDTLKAGSFVGSDATYQAIGKSLAGWIRSLDDFNAGQGAGRLLVDAQPYEALNGSLKEWQATIREFRTDPPKFLYLRFHLF